MAGNERIKTNQLYAAFIMRKHHQKAQRNTKDRDDKGELRTSIREYIKPLKK